MKKAGTPLGVPANDPLQPVQAERNSPVDTYDPTATRLQLLPMAILPLPTWTRRRMLKGWSVPGLCRQPVGRDDKGLEKQHRGFKATGLLVRDGLMPIDLDIRDEAMVDLVLDEVYRIAPDVIDRAPMRTGRHPKLMLFARWQTSTRCPDKFGRIASDKFIDEAGSSAPGRDLWRRRRPHSGGSSIAGPRSPLAPIAGSGV